MPEEVHDIKEKDFFAGERLYMGVTHDNTNPPQDHLDRYNFAKSRLEHDFEVLDAACGSGYGSEILSSACAEVIGVEVSEHALKWAKEHHRNAKIKFEYGDLNKPMPFLHSSSINLIASFETIEHVMNQDVMLSEFKRVLKDDGTLIISSPDGSVINGPGKKTSNPFHVKELSKEEFLTLLDKYFFIESLYGHTKYEERSISKKIVRKVGKAVIPTYFRRAITKKMGYEKQVYEAFSPHRYTPIVPISRDIPSGHCAIIAVCKQK